MARQRHNTWSGEGVALPPQSGHAVGAGRPRTSAAVDAPPTATRPTSSGVPFKSFRDLSS
eukprot:10030678-Alexandrium_andersonii.AAC.1